MVDVRVADGLLGGFEVSRARLGDGRRKQRLDLPDLGHRLGRCGGLLLRFVGATAAGGRAERKGGQKHGKHGSTADSLSMVTFLVSIEKADKQCKGNLTAS